MDTTAINRMYDVLDVLENVILPAHQLYDPLKPSSVVRVLDRLWLAVACLRDIDVDATAELRGQIFGLINASESIPQHHASVMLAAFFAGVQVGLSASQARIFPYQRSRQAERDARSKGGRMRVAQRLRNLRKIAVLAQTPWNNASLRGLTADAADGSAAAEVRLRIRECSPSQVKHVRLNGWRARRRRRGNTQSGS